MQLFVYYTVTRDRSALVAERLRSIAGDLGPRAPRVMRRSDGDSDTWLEFYDGVDAAFEATLATRVAESRLADLTGPRHVERFDDFPVTA